jgi:hypothetical protein
LPTNITKSHSPIGLQTFKSGIGEVGEEIKKSKKKKKKLRHYVTIKGQKSN